MSEAVVLFNECKSAAGGRLGLVTLNSEKTLNSLSLSMIELLNPQLDLWQDDDAIDAVVIRGAGERAFCAGGDIQALYASMTTDPSLELASRFFEQEYRLDYRLHCFGKPVVSVGTGIVMGGGLGIFSASSVRLVGPRSRIAMPELTIGLFPDAGASWILKHLPYHLAAFLAMTGTQCSGVDALYIGLGTHALGSLEGMDERIEEIDWTGLDKLDALEGPGQLETHSDELLDAIGDGPLEAMELVARIDSLKGADDWLDRAIRTMHRGCPTTLAIIAEQLRRVASLDLAGCFRMENNIANHCARNADFREGVRALIVDKDNLPNWKYPVLEATPHEYVLSHFLTPFESHPLEDLGR